MGIFKVRNKEYEIYLSINGLVRVEEALNISFYQIDLDQLNFRSVRAILYGMLWEKHRIGMDDVGQLIEEYLEENNLKSIGILVRDEINLWSKKANKNMEESSEEKKS